MEIVSMQENNLPTAPDFTLEDSKGQTVTLSQFEGQKNVLLVFNRGFLWPFCRRHMAQLRRDYNKFTERETEILVVGPEDKEAFKDYWNRHDLPFIGLPDPDHRVANKYGQQVKLLQMGRMPAQILIDKSGRIRYRHFGNSMADITDNNQILPLLDDLNQEMEIESREIYA